MLKNNDERNNYVLDNENWEEMNYCYLTDNIEDSKLYPRLRVLNLKNTPFVKVQILTKGEFWTNHEAYWITCNIYKLNDKGEAELGTYSYNDIIKWLRENKI